MDFYVNTTKLHAKMFNYLVVLTDMLSKGASPQDIKSSIKGFMDLSDIRSDNYCHAMLKTGPNAGSYCPMPSEEGCGYCKRHNKKENPLDHIKKVTEQKRLLVDGQVVDVVPAKLIPEKPKSLTKGIDLPRSAYGEFFTKSGCVYWMNKDTRPKAEIKESDTFGFIIDRVMEKVEEALDDEEIFKILRNHTWKFINLGTLERGARIATTELRVRMNKSKKSRDEGRIIPYLPVPVEEDVMEQRTKRMFEVVAMMKEILEEQIRKQDEKDQVKKMINNGKMWAYHVANNNGQRLLSTQSPISLVKCQRKILEMMMRRGEPLEKITDIISEGVILETKGSFLKEYLNIIFQYIVPEGSKLENYFHSVDDVLERLDELKEKRLVSSKCLTAFEDLKLLKQRHRIDSFEKVNLDVERSINITTQSEVDQTLEVNTDLMNGFTKSCYDKAKELYHTYLRKDEKKKVEQVENVETNEEVEIQQDKPMSLDQLKKMDYKKWSKLVYQDDCRREAIRQGLKPDDWIINEMIKRTSGRGVTPFIILPPMRYELTKHRNWFCQDIREELYGPYYMVPVLESTLNFKDYGKRLVDHIYIRYEEIVKKKCYKDKAWQLRYHRLALFYKRLFNKEFFHPHLVEAREPITMMRAARILQADKDVRLYALQLDQEYLDDIKEDLYELIFMKGKTKTQDMIVMIYEEFAATYLQQMLRETNLIIESFGDEGVPECFYWMDVSNPPNWIDVEQLKKARAGIRKNTQELDIFSGKYDSKFKLIPSDEFHLLDPIKLYEQYQKGEREIPLSKTVALMKRQQLFDSSKEIAIPIKQQRQVFPTFMNHDMTKRFELEQRKKIEKIEKKVEKNLQKPPELPKVIQPKVELPNCWLHPYKQKLDIPILDFPTREAAKKNDVRIISRIKEPGELDLYYIWRGSLTKYIQENIVHKNKEQAKLILDQRQKIIEGKSKTEKILLARQSILKDAKLDEKFFIHSYIVRLSSEKNYEEISRAMGHILEDVDKLFKEFKKDYWDPRICLEILDAYRGIVDKILSLAKRKIDNKIVMRESPTVSGDITVLNCRYEFTEVVEKFPEYERNLAAKLADDIIMEYDIKFDQGLCKMIPMQS